MTYTKSCNLYHANAARLGVPYDAAEILRRAATVLHRWYEAECGTGNAFTSWCIERDEATGIPYKRIATHRGDHVHRVADREKGALRRIKAACDAIGATYETQGDPRGWPLKIKFPCGAELSPPPRSAFN